MAFFWGRQDLPRLESRGPEIGPILPLLLTYFCYIVDVLSNALDNLAVELLYVMSWAAFLALVGYN